jgi:hypothetical protein
VLSFATALCKQGAVRVVFCCLLVYEFLVFRFFHMIQQDLICSDHMSFDIMVLTTISQTKKHEKEQGLNFALLLCTQESYDGAVCISAFSAVVGSNLPACF